MSARQNRYAWKDKVINIHQIGGIETAVLDNGLGKGVRIAWINTGGGLRYKVVIDRALDIADAFYHQHSLCWLSHAGITSPRPDCDHDVEWLSTFGGGLMTTCGLSHAGVPESDQYGTRGLHGKISNQPAAIESIIQPDPAVGKLDMSITGVVKESKVFGPNLELRRTISSTIGCPHICISDVVTNRGNTKVPHMILYHCNYGWPLVDEGTQIIWKGSCSSLVSERDNAIFNNKMDCKVCQKPLGSHRGRGEACGLIDVKADRNSLCNVGFYNRRLDFAVSMKYSKKQLPWLTNWQHWGCGEYVTGLEPGTNPPIGQKAAREQKTLIYLEPGQSRTYALEIEVLNEREQIKKFIS